MNFVDDLEIDLTLTIAGSAHKLPPGNIAKLTFDLRPYGYTASVAFVVVADGAEDNLLAAFQGNDLIEVSLTVAPFFKPQETTLVPLQLHGLATRRAYSEQTPPRIPLQGEPVLYRHYALEFADPAQVLWTQHFPCDLLTESTMETLFNNHKGDKIDLTFDWDVLETQHSHIALPLGSDANPASFYDFTCWFIDTQGGVLTYDATQNRYRLGSSKPLIANPDELLRIDYDTVRVLLPEVPRHQPRVLNGYSENPQTKSVSNAQAVTPIRRDHLSRYPVAADLESRVDLESKRLRLPEHRVELELQRFPFAARPPGAGVKLQGPGWSSALYVTGKTYRVWQWQLEATAEDDSVAHNGAPYARYAIAATLTLETSSDDTVTLPPYAPPRYPFYVEGKMVSEPGSDTDATYQFTQDAQTSAEYYLVSIPLWNNQNVRTPFEPGLLSGQFYCPIYKHARLLIALDLYQAHVETVLDWRLGVRVPNDTQGNQWVLGKSTTNQTYLKHVYVDEKPELQLQRVLDNDTELLKLSEGSILLQTMEQGGTA